MTIDEKLDYIISMLEKRTNNKSKAPQWALDAVRGVATLKGLPRGGRMTATEIASIWKLQPKRSDVLAISAALRQLGCVSRKSNGRRLFDVTLIEPD